MSCSPPPSPGASGSLMDTMEDTRLVLSAFLRQSLNTAPSHRPGRVGGAYKDANKFSSHATESRQWVEDDWDSLDEQISAAEEKKHGFKDLIRKRLCRRRRLASQSPEKGRLGAVEPTRGHVQSGLSQRQGSEAACGPAHSQLMKEKPALEEASGSSSSEEGQERNEKRKKTKLQALSSFLCKINPFRREGADGEWSRARRLGSPPYTEGPENRALSCTYPPQFYDEVAGTLDKIAQKYTTTRPERSTLVDSQSADTTDRENCYWSSAAILPTSSEKEDVVRQLVKILTMQGDAIDSKITSDPVLRSTLARLSYPSFSKLLDMFASQGEAPAAPFAGSTLSRVAMTMEASRRIVTATGTQRMCGYAEQYMQNFVPWVHSKGGWEKIVQSGDLSEYD